MRLEAVLFDLDGTLVSSELDFDAIRAEAGISGGPILEYLGRVGPEERQRVNEILERHEALAALRCTVAAGAPELLSLLAERGIKTAILTRNSRKNVDLVLARHGLQVDAVIAREDAAPKPSPEPVRLACRLLGARPERALVVGDYKFDIEAGNHAGARTALICAGKKPDGVESSFVVRSLVDLVPVVERMTADG